MSSEFITQLLKIFRGSMPPDPLPSRVVSDFEPPYQNPGHATARAG